MGNVRSPVALFIIDMQNAVVHPQGTFGKMGLPIQNHLDIIPTIEKLRKQAYAHGVPVFFTALEFKHDYSDSGILLDDLPPIKEMQGFVQGSWDAAVVDQLAPDLQKDVLIRKTRNSGFYRTDLEKQLRDRGIKQLLFTGVGTNVCVESTVREAFTLDFPSKTISDATATLTAEERDASLKNLSWFGGVIDSQKAMDILGGKD